MKRMIVGAALLIAGLFLQTASAQTVAGTQVKQHMRIQQGVKSGELTYREAKLLRMQQADIRHDKRIAKADGVVTPAERRYIRAEQAHADKAIYVRRHNGR